MFKVLRNKCNYYQGIVKPMMHRYSSGTDNKRKFEGITFQVPIPENRFKEVLNHMRNNFYVEEPMLASLKISKRGKPQRELDEYCMGTLKEGYSIAALDSKTNKIIAVAMNGIMRSSDPPDDFQQKIDKMTGKIKLVFEILYKSNEHLDLFCNYGADEIFESRLLSVDSNYYGRGLAKELLRRSEDLIKESGFKLAKTDSTGFYSQNVYRGMGFETIHEIRYSCYKDKQGNVIFKTAPPHETLAVMVKQYSSDK